MCIRDSNSGGSAKDPEIAFTSDNADTFIAGDASKTLTLKGALHTRGTVLSLIHI